MDRQIWWPGFACLLFVFVVNIKSFDAAAPGMKCPESKWLKYGPAPPSSCPQSKDPQKKPKSGIETWFTEEMFNDLFMKANLGHGPSKCRPYNYDAFVIAARYFPKFGNEFFSKDPMGNALHPLYTEKETHQRDVAGFFAHAIQETGENNGHLYQTLSKAEADACFYRGGFFNWFEGGPGSPFVKNGGLTPEDGDGCTAGGRYCDENTNNNDFYPCAKGQKDGHYIGCYYGRGAIQISYNYNYGYFNRWLNLQGITHNGKPIDVLKDPNLVMTKTDPPLAVLASLWFYMTPQSPKPAMHDIVIGNWISPDKEYRGPVFGPTSLVINNECGGEDKKEPGGAGESRRIKAFKWFNKYFGARYIIGTEKTLTCKNFNGGKHFKFPATMPKLAKVGNSWDADWSTSWDSSKPCTCKRQTYQGVIPAYDPLVMPHMETLDMENKRWCEELLQGGWRKQECAKYKPSRRNFVGDGDDGGPPVRCRDRATNCKAWAKLGRCEDVETRDFMKAMCREACGHC